MQCAQWNLRWSSKDWSHDARPHRRDDQEKDWQHAVLQDVHGETEA